MKMDVTVIIIARNEAANLRWLLPELVWARRVVVIGNDCTDETSEVVRASGAEFVVDPSHDFAALRERALSQVTTSWLFYLDADERVTPDLAREICQTITDTPSDLAALSLCRENYHYGRVMKHGGWGRERVTRIFRREALQGWTGAIHETPVFAGVGRELFYPLIHFTHRCTADNLRKSARWTIEEAKLLAASDDTPCVTGWTIMRKTVMEFYRRFVRDGGWHDGTAGLVESVVQAFNRACVYIQVWELQSQPSIGQRYEELEKQVRQSWQEVKVES